MRQEGSPSPPTPHKGARLTLPRTRVTSVRGRPRSAASSERLREGGAPHPTTSHPRGSAVPARGQGGQPVAGRPPPARLLWPTALSRFPGRGSQGGALCSTWPFPARDSPAPSPGRPPALPLRPQPYPSGRGAAGERVRAGAVHGAAPAAPRRPSGSGAAIPAPAAGASSPRSTCLGAALGAGAARREQRPERSAEPRRGRSALGCGGCAPGLLQPAPPAPGTALTGCARLAAPYRLLLISLPHQC